jgi:hypothetical protein
VDVTADEQIVSGPGACADDGHGTRTCIASANKKFMLTHVKVVYAENTKEIFSIEQKTDPRFVMLQANYHSDLGGPDYLYIFDGRNYVLSRFGAPATVTFHEEGAVPAHDYTWDPTGPAPTIPTWITHFPGIQDRIGWADPFLRALPDLLGLRDDHEPDSGITLQSWGGVIKVAGDILINIAFAGAGPAAIAMRVASVAIWHEVVDGATSGDIISVEAIDPKVQPAPPPPPQDAGTPNPGGVKNEDDLVDVEQTLVSNGSQSNQKWCLPFTDWCL